MSEKRCKIDGCNGIHQSEGLCPVHLSWFKSGVTSALGGRTCLDCGVDISGRGTGAIRCKEHSAEWVKSNNRARRAANPDKARENERRILRQWRLANPEKLREQRERGNESHKRRNLEGVQQRRLERELARRSRAEEKERRRLEYAARVPLTKEQVAQRKRRYNLDHKEHLREQKRIYWVSHPEKKREKRQRSKARRRARLGVVSPGIVIRLLSSQQYLCASCGTDIRSPQPYHLDHIFPLARGGMHEDSNLQCLCPTCNISKGAKLPAEWDAYKAKGRDHGIPICASR